MKMVLTLVLVSTLLLGCKLSKGSMQIEGLEVTPVASPAFIPIVGQSASVSE